MLCMQTINKHIKYIDVKYGSVNIDRYIKSSCPASASMWNNNNKK